MNKVLTIGGATQDIFVCYDNLHMISMQTPNGMQPFLALQEGAKIEVQSLDYHTGGGATNSATSFSRLGFSTGCCIKVGNDNQGRHITKELADARITLYSTIDKKIATGTSFILPTKNKDRVALVWRGANTQLQHRDIPNQALSKTECLYITSLSGNASHVFLPLAQHAKKLGKKVTTNPGTSQLTIDADSLIKALPYVDILIMNNHEAHLCMESLIQQHSNTQNNTIKRNADILAPELLKATRTHKNICYDMKNFFKTMLSRGPEIIVVTNGKEGVYVASQNTLLFHPSLPTKIVNTLGAGDAFGSCFVATILKENNIKKGILCGLLNAQSVIEHLDAKSGLLTKQELEKRYQQLRHQALNQFKIYDL